MAKNGFWAKFSGRDSSNDVEQQQHHEVTPTNTSHHEDEHKTSLQDAVSFVTELQSYYYNDICNMQTSLLVDASKKGYENFCERVILQDKTALAEIDKILDQITECQKEYHSIDGKSLYSFFEEIEKDKREEVYQDIFKIIIRLNEINVKQELEQVIVRRLELYRKAWHIPADIKIPRNYNVFLTDWDEDTETYKFGDFEKIILSNPNNTYHLSQNQLDSIHNMKIKFKFDQPSDFVLVRCTSNTRAQVNFLYRTTTIGSTLEKLPSENGNKLFFDLVRVSDLDYYLKGVIQILLANNTYAVISIINQSEYMLNAIRTVELKKANKKIKMEKPLRFILRERSGIYKDNLQVAKIDRRNIPEVLNFAPYVQFKRENFS